MADKRRGSLVDLEIILKNKEKVTLTGVGIKIFDAIRQMPPGSFDKRFMWGHDAGVDVGDISGYRVISQYDDDLEL